MRRARRTLPAPLLCLLTLLAFPPPSSGQAAPAAGSSADPFLDAFVAELEVAREKLVGLARAIPPEDWDWRPGAGVRSVREVFIHVAADNYVLPTAAGVAAPPETGISGDDFATVRRFQDQDASRSETLAMLEASFDHLIDALTSVEPGALEGEVGIFGQRFTRRGLWTRTTTHVHEHLGQMIAYARVNGVVPPWSR